MDRHEDDGRPWVRSGKIRARLREQGGVELHIEGLTTQTKYYKPLVREFFRKIFQEVRPRWGDFEVHIRMEFKGDPPWMDLDNLAKALLDSACGAVFHDDSQVARLLVERVQADREGVWMRLSPAGLSPQG